ncbi:MAG TPA: twin-arginine translocase TatA/TatE family subunit [Spirochaetes bacterium]|nr:twin-arginine translocase TatA/TatE family subunit [Spirochaetota bacterium]
MGSLGPTEIILIVVALLVLFGAKKLPEIGKSLGKGLREFKKATKEMSAPIKDNLLNDEEDYVEPVAETPKNTENKTDSHKKEDQTTKV